VHFLQDSEIYIDIRVVVYMNFQLFVQNKYYYSMQNLTPAVPGGFFLEILGNLA